MSAGGDDDEPLSDFPEIHPDDFPDDGAGPPPDERDREAPKRPRGRPRKNAQNGSVTVGGQNGSPEVTLKIKPPRAPSTVEGTATGPTPAEKAQAAADAKKTSVLELMGGSIEGLIRVERTATNGDIPDSDRGNYLGYVGEFEDSPGFESMLMSRFGGGQYKISGKVKGEVITRVLPLAGESKPIVEGKGKKDDDIFLDDFPPPSVNRAPFTPYPQYPQPGYPQPNMPPGQQAWWNQGGHVSSAEEKRIREAWEREREERRKLEEEQRLAKLKAEFEEKYGKNAPPRVDPMESYLKMLQAQTEAQNARWEQERKERLDREDREAREKREREDRIEKEKREREEREEKARREDRERQDKFMHMIVQMNSPEKSLAMLTALKPIASPSQDADPVSNFSKMVKAFEAYQTLKGGGEPVQSEIAEKAQAAKEIIQTTGQVLGPALQSVMERLAPKPGAAGAEPQLSPEEYGRRAAEAYRQQLVRARMAQQRAQQQVQGVQGSAPAPQVAQEPKPVQDVPVQQPAASEDQNVVYFKILNWAIDKHEKKNDAKTTALMLKVYADGLGAVQQLGEISEETVESMETKLSVAIGMIPEPHKAGVQKLLALLKDVEGRVWIGSLLEGLKEQFPERQQPKAGA